jgi:arylsulfatase
VVSPKDAPNVLLVMTDDVGFGDPGTFHGSLPLPRKPVVLPKYGES